MVDSDIESEREPESAKFSRQGTATRTAYRSVLQCKELSSSNPPSTGGRA